MHSTTTILRTPRAVRAILQGWRMPYKSEGAQAAEIKTINHLRGLEKVEKLEKVGNFNLQIVLLRPSESI